MFQFSYGITNALFLGYTYPGSATLKLATPQAESYKHADVTSPMRPDVGTQAQFRKKKPPATYRYDSSISPALDWDHCSAQSPSAPETRPLKPYTMRAPT